MRADKAFSDLIGRIYDCALDTSRWPDVLAEISDVLDGAMAELSVIAPLDEQWHIAATYNWPDDVIALAREHFRLNPATPLGLVAALGEPMCSTRNLDIEAFHRSKYWQACFAGRGYYDYLTVVLTPDVTSFVYWGVTGDRQRGAFSDDDLDLARLISPHIRRSVGISDVFGHLRVQVGTLQSALNALSTAAIILDPDGTVQFKNAQAEVELSPGHLFRERKVRLQGVTKDAAELLGRLAVDSHQRGRDAHLTDKEGGIHYATWIALRENGSRSGGPVLLVLRRPLAEIKTPLSAALALFHLTSGEAQVLAQILNGRSLVEIAEIVGVARSTAKSHLDAIFRKTQTHRQADLVRLALSLVSPIRE